jgi:hypothetical protein
MSSFALIVTMIPATAASKIDVVLSLMPLPKR